MRLALFKELCRQAGYQYNLEKYLDDQPITGFCIDTRVLKAGNIFIAFSGEKVDGHDYLDQAYAAGALACMVERPGTYNGPYVKVDNSHKATVFLARLYRAGWLNHQVIAITGSVGKTTCKSLIAWLLAQIRPVHATHANQNNLLGCALTLLNKPATATSVVIELGISESGEMKQLAELVRPTLALVTNIGPCHLEGLRSMEQIAREKAEMLRALPTDGLAILPADSDYLSFLEAASTHCQRGYFAVENKANKALIWTSFQLEVDEKGCAKGVIQSQQGQEYEIRLGLLGRHQWGNMLAALSCIQATAAQWEIILATLPKAKSELMRLETWQYGPDKWLVLDHYKADPPSLRAALSVLASLDKGARCLVLADMLELGSECAYWHKQAAHLAKQSGVTHLITYGAKTQLTNTEFEGSNKWHAQNIQECAQLVLAILSKYESVVVLYKGSRKMQLEQAITPMLGSARRVPIC